MTQLILHPPLVIGPRLLPAVVFEGTYVSLDPGDWTIIIDHEGEEYIDNTFRPGAFVYGDDDSTIVRHAMGSVLSFLGAFAEAHDPYYLDRYGPGEHHDLFHPDLGEWAYQNSDEIAMTQHELEHLEDEEE